MRTREDGQATVELVALLPLLAVVGLVAWQLAVAGQALWSSHAAARAAARAAAVGGDARGEARRLIPRRARPSATVSVGDDGRVAVGVPVPAVLGRGTVGRVTARSSFERQR